MTPNLPGSETSGYPRKGGSPVGSRRAACSHGAPGPWPRRYSNRIATWTGGRLLTLEAAPPTAVQLTWVEQEIPASEL